MTGARQSIVIIGGGASGVLLAAHLLRDPDADVRVTLIERREQLGRGVAYSARQQEHVLNVAAPRMSAFADDPDHFWRWLRARNAVGETERFSFVPRKLYGAYLSQVIAEADPAGEGRLQTVHDDCVGLKTSAAGVEVKLGNGSSVLGHVAVLAVGHEETAANGRRHAVRVGSAADTPLDADAPVMVLGSGLSMVDAWLSLSHARHRGPITVVSRHGLLPLRHREVDPIELEAADVPFGTDLHYFTAWLRELVRDAELGGTDWRGVVDALRPFNQRIWQDWSDRSRRRFLEHIRPLWNIHRHRLPPETHDALSAAVASGQVRLVAGKVLSVDAAVSGVSATIRRRGTTVDEVIPIARVYDCGGVTVDVEKSANPVIGDLLASRTARADRLHIGLDVTRDCAVVDRDGWANKRLFAVGPLTRGTFFEIEAIPDIRVQVAQLATRLLGRNESVARQRAN